MKDAYQKMLETWMTLENFTVQYRKLGSTDPWLTLKKPVYAEFMQYRLTDEFRSNMTNPCGDIKLPEHSFLISLWAKDPSISFQSSYNGKDWRDAPHPTWDPSINYRVKPAVPHVHAELIAKWLEDSSIKLEQRPGPIDEASEQQIHWAPVLGRPAWYPEWQYRVALNETVLYMYLHRDKPTKFFTTPVGGGHNVKVVFDATTRELKAIEKV